MSQINATASSTYSGYYAQQAKSANNNLSSSGDSAISSILGENSAQPKDIASSSDDKKIQRDYSEEFLAYMKKTPAQRLREDLLKKLDLTESDLENMPPEKREAIEKTIAAEIKKALQADNSNSPRDSILQSFSSFGGQNLSDRVNSQLLSLQEVGQDLMSVTA